MGRADPPPSTSDPASEEPRDRQSAVDLGSAAGDPDAATARLEKLARQGGHSRYVLGDEVARGGMGAVLEVFDTDLRRSLAMKVALGPEPDAGSIDPVRLARFLEEAQVTGQLDHPGVVPVHELGVGADGRVYFTMSLVKGEELSRIIERVHAGDEDWTLTRALGVFLASRLRETVGRLAYGKARVLDEDVESEDEIDLDLLDSTALASARFEWMLRRLSGN